MCDVIGMVLIMYVCVVGDDVCVVGDDACVVSDDVCVVDDDVCVVDDDDCVVDHVCMCARMYVCKYALYVYVYTCMYIRVCIYVV